jgi:ABC-type multidrug transport system fused ATPase/permease subunit
LCISGLNVYGKLFVTDWTDKAEKDDKDQIKKEDNYKFFIKYSLIIFAGIVIQMIKEFLIAYSNYRGTKNLHEDMISNVMNAPINLFHDILPIGQILNRLIHDLEKSENIIWTFNTILVSLIGILTSVYVCFMENRETIYAAPVIILLAVLLVIYFISAGRDLDRLDGTSRSPIVSLFSETILGITTIRTFKQEAPSKDKFYKRLDDHYGVMLYRHGTDNWLCNTLDLISHIFLTYVLIRIIISMDSFGAATVGIMLDYSIEFSEELLEAFEQATQVEKSLISLERCDAFTHLPCENYENEKLKEKKYDLSEKSWPDEGKVIFDHFSMKYREDCDLALSDINITINPGEKIGIIGRTGSGKSSLTLSLFRIIEAFKGNIKIDNCDIRDIPLKKLRRSLSIVPQEPFLLEGTLKTNLDPLHLYSDSELDDILKNVKLYEMLEHDNANKHIKLNGIDTEIKEYGNNLSFGCRQLLCVARAFLRKSKVIILDEATSSVDQKTEDIISGAVETMFKDSTVIIIAHRINTVKKCDRIIVMDDGKIVEVGKPDELIKDPNSKFYSLYYQYIGAIQ